MARLVRIVLFAFSLYFLVLSGFELKRMFMLRKEITRLRERIEALSLENDQLLLEIENLKSNKFYIERTVREELGWVKRNETIFLLR